MYSICLCVLSSPTTPWHKCVSFYVFQLNLSWECVYICFQLKSSFTATTDSVLLALVFPAYLKNAWSHLTENTNAMVDGIQRREGSRSLTDKSTNGFELWDSDEKCINTIANIYSSEVCVETTAVRTETMRKANVGGECITDFRTELRVLRIILLLWEKL